MSPRTSSMNGTASRVRPSGMSSGNKMKETYGVRKRNRNSGHRMREVYAKTRDSDRPHLINQEQQLVDITYPHATNGHSRLFTELMSSTRKDSTGSTDSNDSDCQLLCTEDRCIMDAASSKYSRNEVRRRNTKNTTGGLVSPPVTTTGKLCKSCRGEMQESSTSRGLAVAERKQKTFYSRTRVLQRTLSDIMPKWLSEPEYMMHAKPRLSKDHIHRHTDSLFSTSSGFTNYYGLLNLALILLVLGNARLFLENIIKYGILINLSFLKIFLREPYNWPNLLLTFSIPIFPAIALLTEKALFKNWISDHVGFAVYCVNLGTLLLLPAGVIYYIHPVMVFSLGTLGLVTICFLKLASYGHTNYWCRESSRAPAKLKRSRSIGGSSPEATKSTLNNNKTIQVYPENLNVRDMIYYLLAPTICYEINFPRSARIRLRFLTKRLLEVIPNHLIWLVFFYCFFHSMLNVLAELTKFGDREFYSDWWNAEAVSDFWKDWNIPVHRFCTRHIYKPLLRKGLSKLAASTCVFLVSAFFHEYLVSVPLRMFKAWAFMGMLMQVPIAYVTGKYIKGKWGNIVMWLSLILGQPVAILAYFHDYYITHSLPLHNATMPSNGL
ncbi:O-acyltransferase [Elysia marginata]|uniref:diacylglycerol O-acyltransferase n=1 Tax=Elysia marginata TaxID=1093978 RepID=A0AAV4H8V1_9GAST|nr:O-acyltransferase [Elysia marginata]